MKKGIVICALFVSVFTFVTFVSVFAQETMNPEQFYLNQKSAEQFQALRQSARGSFTGILLYPKDIRDSVLELSQYPELVVLVKNHSRLKDNEFEGLLAKYPEPAQKAAKSMQSYLEIVEIMNKNLVVTALLGEIYQDNKEATSQVIDRLSERAEQGHALAVTGWTQKLNENPDAIRQLQDASAQYAAAHSRPDPNQPLAAGQPPPANNPYGYYVDSSSEVIVNDMPDSETMNYMLVNSMMQFALMAVVLDHHEDYHDDYYWATSDEAWNRYEDYWDEQFNDLEDEIDDIAGDREDIRDDYQDRVDEIKKDREERKQERSERPVNQPVRDAGRAEGIGQNPVRGGGQGQMPRADLQPSQGLNAGRQPSIGQQPRVNFNQPSRDFQTNRARDFHSQSWGGTGGGNVQRGSRSDGGRVSSGGEQRSGSRGGSSGGRQHSGGGSRQRSGGGRR